MRKNRAQIREDRIFGIVEKLFDNEDIVRSLIAGVGGAAAHMPWNLEVEIKSGGIGEASTRLGPRFINTVDLRVIFWMHALARQAYGFGPRIDGKTPGIFGGGDFALGITLTPDFYRIELVLADETFETSAGDTRPANVIVKERIVAKYLPTFQMLFLAYGFGLGTLGAQLLTVAAKGVSAAAKTGAEYLKGAGEVIPG